MPPPHARQLKAPLEPSGSEIRAFWRGTGWSLLDFPDAAALRFAVRGAPPELFPGVRTRFCAAELRRFPNYRVSDIADGNDEISGFTGEVVANSVVIREYKKFHGQTRASAA